ncbi:MAG TPA: class I SAM-dependent methyltransferase [Thermoanaerobaculia bacterium]
MTSRRSDSDARVATPERAAAEYRTIFDARGVRYNHANRLFPEARAEEGDRMIAHLALPGSVRWLDVGAGGGFLAERAAAAGRAGEPIACDASAVFLSEARGYALRIAGDYERLPFPDGAFRAAGCLAVLHHAEAPERVVSEMLRVTGPGGRIAVGDAAAGSRAARFLNAFVDAHTEQGHAGRFYDEGTLAGFVEGAGGRGVRAEAIEISWRFASGIDARAFCRELFGLQPDTRDADLHAALSELGLEESKGGWRVPWDMVFVSAAA